MQSITDLLSAQHAENQAVLEKQKQQELRRYGSVTGAGAHEAPTVMSSPPAAPPPPAGIPQGPQPPQGPPAPPAPPAADPQQATARAEVMLTFTDGALPGKVDVQMARNPPLGPGEADYSPAAQLAAKAMDLLSKY